MAWEEGGIFQLTMHPHHSGYRSRVWILEELIRHAEARGGVWFTTHAGVVRFARATRNSCRHGQFSRQIGAKGRPARRRGGRRAPPRGRVIEAVRKPAARRGRCRRGLLRHGWSSLDERTGRRRRHGAVARVGRASVDTTCARRWPRSGDYPLGGGHDQRISSRGPGTGQPQRGAPRRSRCGAWSPAWASPCRATATSVAGPARARGMRWRGGCWWTSSSPCW